MCFNALCPLIIFVLITTENSLSFIRLREQTFVKYSTINYKETYL